MILSLCRKKTVYCAPSLPVIYVVYDSIRRSSSMTSMMTRMRSLYHTHPTCQGFSGERFQHIRRFCGSRRQKLLPLMDVLQIMGIGIVDDLTAIQIGIFLLQSLQIVQIGHLGTGKMTVRGNETQIVQQAVGILVDVGRDHDAAELLHDVLRRRKGDLGTADEQIFHLARRFVVLIVNDLPPEQVFPVGKGSSRSYT